MIRFGLCCIFHQEPIKFKTVTAHNLKKEKISQGNPYLYLSHLIFENIQSLHQAIFFCINHKIGSFRINSGLFPLYTHPDFAYQLEMLPNYETLLQLLLKCKQLASQNQIRLVFHPDQFVILNSPNEEVVKNSIAEIEYHAVISDFLGVDVINIHAGGVYGNKEAALERLAKNFALLSPSAKRKLTLENDDKNYTPQDLIPLCLKLTIPFVYDVHHHRCLPDGLSIEEATTQAIKTWNREPLFHISSPKEGWKGSKPYRHHDFIDIVDFPECWMHLENITIEVEAKAKEVAVQKLMLDLDQKFKGKS